MPSLPECDVTQQFYHERRFVASGRAKKLKCCECCEQIEKGNIYMRCTGKWDGSLWSGAQHLECWLFARSMNGHDSTGWYKGWSYQAGPELVKGTGLNAWGFNGGFGECVPFEGVAEFLGECECDGEFLGLTHNPKRFWDAMRSGCKEMFCGGSGI